MSVGSGSVVPVGVDVTVVVGATVVVAVGVVVRVGRSRSRVAALVVGSAVVERVVVVGAGRDVVDRVDGATAAAGSGSVTAGHESTGPESTATGAASGVVAGAAVVPVGVPVVDGTCTALDSDS